MARQPKPFFHRGWWCSNVGGTRTKLARGRENKALAKKTLLALVVNCRDKPGPKTGPPLTVTELCDRFLSWVEIHRAQDTYDDYLDWLTRWKKLHGKRKAQDIRSIDLEDWKSSLAGTGVSNWTI